MEFDSPEAAKEFPGLYDAGKAEDTLEYTDDGDKKKSKKEKKKDKDKGYSALAAESSQEEDDAHDPKSPGKGKKIKAFSKLSGKKKEKDKKPDKSEKDLKKAEKELKEKRKSEEKERKSMEKEQVNVTPVSVRPPQVPFSGAHLIKTNSISVNHSPAVLAPQASIDLGMHERRAIKAASFDIGRSSESTPTKPHKEKSSSFNVFLNAPAPLLSKLKDKDSSKDKEKRQKKEHKDKEKKSKDKGESKGSKDREQKEKEKKEKDHSHASGMAKVKLKLMRSKNSLDDGGGDVPHITSHQFPEDPDALAKEIKKYEGLLENAHSNLKSTKKISKKQEEQLWELQRTLTQLKRKLRSINALSSASAYHVHVHPSTIDQALSHPRPFPEFKKCDSIDGYAAAKVDNGSGETKVSVDRKTSTDATLNTTSNEIPKLPMPPSKNSLNKDESSLPMSKIPSPPQSVPCDTVTSNAATSNVTSESLSSPPATVVSPTETVVQEQNLKRTIIDTTAEVHSPSVSEIKGSDPDAEFEQSDKEVDRERSDENYCDDESVNRSRSVDNYSPEQEESKENILAVVDDANKMIGSMHEELIFDSTTNLADNARLESSDKFMSPGNRMSEHDDSDVEFFNNDLELDPEAALNEEPCPDPFIMPIFDTSEYIIIENEAISMFADEVKEDINKEHRELEELLQDFYRGAPTSEPENDESANSQNEHDISDLVTILTHLKNENQVLWENVNRLRLAVATCRVDEFRLQTRLKYLEAKAAAVSPVTTTTPLQTEG